MRMECFLCGFTVTYLYLHLLAVTLTLYPLIKSAPFGLSDLTYIYPYIYIYPFISVYICTFWPVTWNFISVYICTFQPVRCSFISVYICTSWSVNSIACLCCHIDYLDDQWAANYFKFSTDANRTQGHTGKWALQTIWTSNCTGKWGLWTVLTSNCTGKWGLWTVSALNSTGKWGLWTISTSNCTSKCGFKIANHQHFNFPYHYFRSAKIMTSDTADLPPVRSATAIRMPWSNALASSERSKVRPYRLSSVFQWCHLGLAFVYCISFFSRQSSIT